MSKAELSMWRTWLIVGGIGAVVALCLPVQGLILLMYVGVGLLLVFAPGAFMYLLGTFALSAVMSLFAPTRPFLRLAISVAVVAGVANLVATGLNAPVDKAFAQVAAEDVRLKAPPSISRIVLVDDRKETGNRANKDDDGRSPCQNNACIPYLMNGQAEAVLFPMHPADRDPLTQRVYRIFSQRPGCAPTGDFKDLSGRIWEGGCLADEQTGALAPGDLIVHAFKVAVPHAVADCLCDRVEVLRVTETGLQLIGRETMFQMERFGDFPILERDAGWAGNYYDHGLRWQRTNKSHGRSHDRVLEEDLRLFSRVVSPEVRDRDLTEMASGRRPVGP